MRKFSTENWFIVFGCMEIMVLMAMREMVLVVAEAVEVGSRALVGVE